MVLADHSEDGLFLIAKFLYNLTNYKLYFNLRFKKQKTHAIFQAWVGIMKINYN